MCNIVFKKNIISSSYYRWIILILFSLLTCINAIIWISFASILTLSQQFYNVTTSSFYINLLSLAYLIMYLPGSLLCTYILHHYGLRGGIYTGSFLNIVAALFRYISTIQYIKSSSLYGPYILVVIGQFIGGLSQPFFTNSPAKLASEWFPADERNICTTIAAMFNPIGIALGQIMPVLMNTNLDNFDQLLLVQFIMTCAVSILAFLLFKKHPELPPNITASRKNLLKARTYDDEEEETHYLDDFKILLKNREFLKLLAGFGIGLGMFNGLSTLIQEFVTPAGYSSDDAGIFGGLIIGGGLVGAAIAGGLLDYTHEYKLILKICVSCALGSSIFLIFSLTPDNGTVLTVAFGILGFSMIPLLPATFETAVEYSNFLIKLFNLDVPIQLVKSQVQDYSC